MFEHKFVKIFLQILGAQMNHLNEAVLLSAHNMWFG